MPGQSIRVACQSSLECAVLEPEIPPALREDFTWFSLPIQSAIRLSRCLSFGEFVGYAIAEPEKFSACHAYEKPTEIM